MTVLELSRWQFGITTVYHFIFVPAQMDEVVVLARGRVVERGTHRDLVAGGGLYQQMWQTHSGSGRGDCAPLGSRTDWCGARHSGEGSRHGLHSAPVLG